MWNVLHWSTYIIIDVAPPGTEQRNPHSSHMSDKLPVCLSVWLSFSLCVCLSVCLSLPVCLFVRFYFRHFGWLVAVAFQRDESLTGSHHTPPPLPPPLPTPQFVGFCCRWLWFCCACVCVRVCTRFLSCCYCCKTTMRFHSQLSSCLFVRVTLLSSGVRACVCVCLLSYVSCIVQSSQWNVAYQSRCVRLKGRCRRRSRGGVVSPCQISWKLRITSHLSFSFDNSNSSVK